MSTFQKKMCYLTSTVVELVGLYKCEESSYNNLSHPCLLSRDLEISDDS